MKKTSNDRLCTVPKNPWLEYFSVNTPFKVTLNILTISIKKKLILLMDINIMRRYSTKGSSYITMLKRTLPAIRVTNQPPAQCVEIQWTLQQEWAEQLISKHQR